MAREDHRPLEVDARDGQFDRKFPAILSHRRDLQPFAKYWSLAGVSEMSKALPVRLAKRWRDNQFRHFPAQRFGPTIAESTLGRGVPFHDNSTTVH
jgi:hypothetical protein